MWVLLAALALVLSASALLPHLYRGEAIELRVVDQDGKALDGVIVTANWELRAIYIEPKRVGQVMVMEAVSDASGRVTLPAWGPKLVRPGRAICSEDPQLVFFKPGYLGEIRTNPSDLNRIFHGILRHSYWNGATIVLNRAEDPRRYIAQFEWLDRVLDFAFVHHDCAWREIPRMIAAVVRESERLRAQGTVLDFAWTLDTVRNKADGETCGSVWELLHAHTPS